MPVASPLKTRKVTSGFRTKARPKHNGTDYRAPKGTALYAAIGGVVKTGTGHAKAGTWVEIHGDDGVMVGYSHMSTRNVVPGQRVKSGVRIGSSGATGRVFGAHLHWYVRLDGVPTNPEVWISKELAKQAAAEAAASKPKPVAKPKTTEDYMSRAELRTFQEWLRKKYPAYRLWVNVKRGQLITADGVDGPQTKAWVREFQKRTGLTPDEIAGPKTIAEAKRRGFKF